MVNWPDIDTVLLDMDGTLLDLSYDNFFWLEYLPEKYADHHNVGLDQAREFLEQKSNSLRGSLAWYCLDRWSRDLQMDIHALKEEVRHHIRARPHTPDFLAFLKSLNKNVMLVTNAHPSSLLLKVQASGLHLHLEKMISSHEFNLAKENEGFWLRLQDRECFDLSRSLLIDDNPSVLAQARAEGIAITLQMLQPDSTLAPVSSQHFPGIIHFTEIMSR